MWTFIGCEVYLRRFGLTCEVAEWSDWSEPQVFVCLSVCSRVKALSDLIATRLLCHIKLTHCKFALDVIQCGTPAGTHCLPAWGETRWRVTALFGAATNDITRSVDVIYYAGVHTRIHTRLVAQLNSVTELHALQRWYFCMAGRFSLFNPNTGNIVRIFPHTHWSEAGLSVAVGEAC